jgi:hypothetical protein
MQPWAVDRITLPLSGRQGEITGGHESLRRPVHSKGLFDEATLRNGSNYNINVSIFTREKENSL